MSPNDRIKFLRDEYRYALRTGNLPYAKALLDGIDRQLLVRGLR